ADVFAYMEAASHTDSRYTLGDNWRSDPALIKAINTIFSGTALPFIYDEIPFSPARPAKEDGCEYLTIDGQREAPLQLWFLNSCALGERAGEGGNPAVSGKPISKSRARNLIARAVAGEISRLLTLGGRRQALIGQNPLREKDIAVLVRTNGEARLVEEKLSALKITSVLYSTGSVFATYEAQEMERVLIGIAKPHREELVRAALAADMIGLSGEELDHLLNDENTWGKRLARFRNYHELWQRHGFIVMFRSFMANEAVRAHLLCLPGGERRLTNVLHLSEILHRESMEQKLSMRGLVKWLGEQRESEMPAPEEHLLRLESDENAVRIVTIHKSKGMEYPVVFCPFAWGGAKVAGPPFFVHERAELPAAQGAKLASEWQLTCDLGSPNTERHRLLAQRELLAENIRLLYVALTRARNRCYLIWGRINEAGTSAPAYLFHRDREEAAEDLIADAEKRFNSMSDEDLYRELEDLADKAEETIGLAAMPSETGMPYSPRQYDGETLNCRKFTGKIDHSSRITSFSSLSHPFEAGLISGQPRSAELPDHDAHYASATGRPGLHPEEGAAFLHEVASEEAAAGENADIFAFPKGARAGTLLHDILEHLDFTEKDEALTRSMVGNKLQEYGFEARWEDAVVGMIRRVVSLPLDPDYHGGGGGGSFTLSAIPQKERLQELEFYFPLKHISPETLRGIFAASGRTAPSSGEGGKDDMYPLWHERLHFNPVQGFMKGFMDMVFCFESHFYLVDWKSNFLGHHITDYSQAALSEVMAGSFYFLQYHLYTLALHQYLSTRLPGYCYDTHFG
ncbi:MAG: 3'-5' exonuclease, partial [Syntrophales bacterium]|nr:3'-5' exonuclease [Syntrophales bacterium]